MKQYGMLNIQLMINMIIVDEVKSHRGTSKQLSCVHLVIT